MKKSFLFLALISTLSYAQNQRFIYNYSFVKDTLDRATVSKEMMYLDISKGGSKFYSREVAVQDSIMMADFEKQIKTTGGMNVTTKIMEGRKASVRYKIFKTYPKYNVSMETSMGRDAYSVTDERPLEWKISNEKEKIGEFNAQKATVNFAGRLWTAWFSADLPFQDGPYKFHGLPGLIVKMEDQSKTHLFELKGVTKYTEVPETVSEFNTPQKPINITSKQYSKLFTENRNDPAKDMKQMISSGSLAQMKGADGSPIRSSDFIKKIEDNAKIKNAKDNNIIEIDLLKSK